jgi:hypothetical protein
MRRLRLDSGKPIFDAGFGVSAAPEMMQRNTPVGRICGNPDRHDTYRLRGEFGPQVLAPPLLVLTRFHIGAEVRLTGSHDVGFAR